MPEQCCRKQSALKTDELLPSNRVPKVHQDAMDGESLTFALCSLYEVCQCLANQRGKTLLSGQFLCLLPEGFVLHVDGLVSHVHRLLLQVEQPLPHARVHNIRIRCVYCQVESFGRGEFHC